MPRRLPGGGRSPPDRLARGADRLLGAGLDRELGARLVLGCDLSVADHERIPELVAAEHRGTDRRALSVPDAHAAIDLDLHLAPPGTSHTTGSRVASYQ